MSDTSSGRANDSFGRIRSSGLVPTLGFFSTLFILFVRALPSISITEMKELAHHEEHVAHMKAEAKA